MRVRPYTYTKSEMAKARKRFSNPVCLSCERMAGDGTDHLGTGYCWWCEQEIGKMNKGAEIITAAEMNVTKTSKPIVELMAREVRVAEQQEEIQRALVRAKSCLEDMVSMFNQVKEMISDTRPPEALKEIAQTFEDMEYVDAEQGEDILQCVRVLCMGMTEKGQAGPVPISSDTKFTLATKMGEQVRKTAETISKIARDHFDVGKNEMIPRRVLVLHIPMFAEMINKIADGDQTRYEIGTKELMKVLASIDAEVEGR